MSSQLFMEPQASELPVDAFRECERNRPVHPILADELLKALELNGGPDDKEVSHLAQALLRDAIGNRATDIHLDCESRGTCLRLRIDGVLHDAAILPPAQAERLVNQLKSLAGVDPVAIFSAVQARLEISYDQRNVSLRMAIIPTLPGEKMTIRILDPERMIYELDDLGLNEDERQRIQSWFTCLGGLFLVTGPVGSGKTTTLYSLLHMLKLGERSVLTLEDPVEYGIDGISQVQIDTRRGLSFCDGLKAAVRHDPDVILVGELRDEATVQAAYAASALGRTVLGTLHARDIAGTVTVLRRFGLDDRSIASNLSVVVAQRLVRRLCPNCRRFTEPTEFERDWFELIGKPVPQKTWEPGQCDACAGSGFHGRVGVFEVWRLDEEDYHFLLEGPSEREIRTHLSKRGQRRFLADALDKAESGVTTISEVQRLHLAGPAMAPDWAASGSTL